ncbi:MAG: hypothetical protein LBT66_00160 [Methanobrevibacter sp.]|jgi:hypothetical protein|nr:hypothetical protein [Candidatus Methanovirga meridionalis]
MKLNDKYWKSLFEKYNILSEIEDNGSFTISAKQIKEFREPRLMTKFDWFDSKPNLFKENDLSLLPISRGNYIISDFISHHEIESSYSYKTIPHDFPNYIKSINIRDIYSESVALNTALIMGIIQDFIGDEEIVSTVNGRKSSKEFDFYVTKKNGEKLDISVSNSQMEIDGAYEGYDYLSLFEAKIGYPKDFLIRQLYYPFRAFNNIIEKEIRNIFLFYSNDQFSLYEYSFKDKNSYNSIKLEKQSHYLLYDVNILLDDIINIYESVNTIPEPKVPFPQADSFERVISLCEYLKWDKLNKNQIANNYSFNERQSDYYANAAIYLGLVKKFDNGVYYLSKKGKEIFAMPFKEKQLKLVECILKHNVFNMSFKYYVKSGEIPSKDTIVEYMKKCKLYELNSEETYKRRASTISGWIKWILKLKDIEVSM